MKVAGKTSNTTITMKVIVVKPIKDIYKSFGKDKLEEVLNYKGVTPDHKCFPKKTISGRCIKL